MIFSVQIIRYAKLSDFLICTDTKITIVRDKLALKNVKFVCSDTYHIICVSMMRKEYVI